MKKYHMTLNCSQAEATRRLEQQLRVSPPIGIVEENYFRIYKKTTDIFLGKGLKRPVYCFYGNYQQSGKNTYVAYQIRPGFSIFLVYLILSVSTLLALYRVIIENESIVFVGALLCFLLVYYLIMQIQKKKCAADFEKRLITDIRY